MRYRYRDINDENDDLNIWPSFTDLMSNAFMIITLFLLLTLVRSLLLKSNTNDQNKEIIALKKQLVDKQKEIDKLKSPPLIVIKDSDRDQQNRPLKFQPGSADLPIGLRDYVNQKVNQIGDINNYQGYIVDVIGHTDTNPIFIPSSNLDTMLEIAAKGTSQDVKKLTAGSNADLGLMRALAVMKVLAENPRLKSLGLKFRAYSAAQLYPPTTSGKSSDEARRRIEIRFIPPAIAK